MYKANPLCRRLARSSRCWSGALQNVREKMLTLTVHKLCDTTLFRCAGRLVSGESECLRDAVLAQSHARSVVLELAEVRSVDAAGLGILLFLREWAQTTGATFKLMNLKPRVEEVLELTNL